ncbi:hypothetical protein [Bradyrhizobium sp. WSM2254]|uniref:hypothetical protein n=1 Tax=Bradyrhizobium sp. WSM2254 TaxID=1188263 RepID=UPI0012EC9919|nr:hypothetical protein [Bradyrhizobium sp. WSM2254]
MMLGAAIENQRIAEYLQLGNHSAAGEFDRMPFVFPTVLLTLAQISPSAMVTERTREFLGPCLLPEGAHSVFFGRASGRADVPANFAFVGAIAASV